MSKEANKSAQAFVNVEEITGKLLYTADKYLFAFVRCRGGDNSLLDEEDNAALTERMTGALSEETEPYQILSVPRAVETGEMLRELRALRAETDNVSRLRLIDGEAASLQELTESGAREPMICIKLWRKAAPKADRALLDRAALLADRLTSVGIVSAVMEDGDIRHLCMLYAEPGVWQDRETPSDIPVLAGRRRQFSRRASPEEIARAELLEQITPAGLCFTAGSIDLGGCLCRCYGATRYPAEVGYGWLVKLMSATDCITCVTYYPAAAGEIGDALSASVRAATRNAAEEKDVRSRKRYERSAQDADRMIDRLDGDNAPLGQVSIVVMPFGADKEELETVSRDVLSRYMARRMKLKPLQYLQKEALRHISPYYPNQPDVDAPTQRVIPLETLVGGYPCTINTLRDDHGVYFARTADRGIVSLDIRNRTPDRINGNGVTTGISGSGKSTMLKSLLESMFMQGMRCIVIDPEGEFKHLCRSLGGSWLDAGGGAAKNNILQIQAAVKETDDEDGEPEDLPETPETPDALGEHIRHVKTVLRYEIPSLTDIQMSLLERALYRVYAAYGIEKGWVYDPNRSPKDYPVLEDLYRTLPEMARTDSRYDDLALLIESMAVGSEAAVWNGTTCIDFSAPFIVLDTKRLGSAPERTRTAQYYTLMRQVFSIVSADRTTQYLVIADEAQTMLDPDLPIAAKGLKNMALRFRKYEGYLWLAFHSLNELLDDRVREHGQSILDSAAFKILFGTDGKNLADTVSLFRLTTAEQKLLDSRQRGRALALIGAQHLAVNFELPQYKLDLMGKGGGR